MTISRFAFGWRSAQILALFNVAACIGWSAVNSVVGAQIIEVATAGKVRVWVGILLLAGITTPVSLYGYRLVHRFERIAWLPVGAIFVWIALLAYGGFEMPAATPWDWGKFVSFGSAVYGFATGWSSYAADYNVNQPEDTPPARVFWLTYAGCVTPCICLETLGLALTLNPALKGKMGGDLMAAALMPLGSPGQLALLVLALSVVANNIPNDYSLGLSLQVLGRWWQSVSRHIWTLIGAIVYVLLAIPAASHFGETLTDFLLVIGYWLAPWSTVLILDYFVYRLPKASGNRHRAYAAESWDRPAEHPERWSAVVAMAAGLLGAAAGAQQVMWQGPVSRWLGGADVGFELAIAVTALTYLALRRRD
jgi:NCS1 nucleoside transporter family